MSGKRSEKSGISFGIIVGMLGFVILAAYFIFVFVSYRNKNSVSFYEVEQGSLVKEHSYEGLILRKETVKTATANGYINYFIADARKAAMNARVYCIDEKGVLKDYLASHADSLNTLSAAKIQAVRTSVINASRNFDPVYFKSTYLLKDSLNASVLEITDADTLTMISDELKAGGVNFVEYRTDTTGIVSTCIDGYESLLKTDLDESKFDTSEYNRVKRKSGDLVSEGDPAFKLITDETWEIVFPMKEEDIEEFSGKNSLKINFKTNGISAVADFSMFKSMDGNTYGSLQLKRYLIQYISDRFISFEIETNDVSGLKIPEKSITEKNFYLVPAGMKKTDERGNSGFFKEISTASGTEYKFIVSEVYAEDDEYCYVNLPSSGELAEGDILVEPENAALRYQVGPVKPLKGVYNINKGYAVFKRIEELERANGYCIVKKNTPYGLSVYDHIILDASTVTEGQVLY